MRVICKYSATEFKLPDFHGSLIEGIHPFFFLSTKELLPYTSTWAKQELNETESRVLFLALLSSGTTEIEEYDERGRKKKLLVPLVDFRTSAIPSHATVQKNMERLTKSMLWIDNISPALLKLPRFVITHDNRKLENIHNWLQVWEDERNAFYASHKSKALASKLSSLEEQLIRLIRSEHRSTESYAGTLIKWALDASSFPDKTALDLETRGIYTKLFKLKGFDVFTADKDDLEDLLDWMETHLSHGTIMANEVLKHLRKLSEAREKGLQKALGLIKGKTFEFIDDPISAHNIELIASKAPEIFPEPHLYASRVSYLRARSAWNLAEGMKKQAQEEATEKMKRLKEIEDLDFTTEEELEAAIQEEEDLLQGKLNLGDLGSAYEDKEI